MTIPVRARLFLGPDPAALLVHIGWRRAEGHSGRYPRRPRRHPRRPRACSPATLLLPLTGCPPAPDAASAAPSPAPSPAHRHRGTAVPGGSPGGARLRRHHQGTSQSQRGAHTGDEPGDLSPGSGGRGPHPADSNPGKAPTRSSIIHPGHEHLLRQRRSFGQRVRSTRWTSSSRRRGSDRPRSSRWESVLMAWEQHCN